MKRSIAFLFACILVGLTGWGKSMSYAKSNTISEIQNKSVSENESDEATKAASNLLGGLSPVDALEYMKTTDDLVIVEVNTAQWKKSVPFENALWIPHDEMEERYNEIPENKPIILHCGAGVVSVYAYEILKKKRPDILELSYIAGAPPIREYNEWYKKNKSK